MTLKTKFRIFIVSILVVLEAFQFLILRTLLVGDHNGLILLFLMGTTLGFAALAVLMIEGRLLAPLYYINKKLTDFVESSNYLKLSPVNKIRDISQFKDYVEGILEEMQECERHMQQGQAILATAQKYVPVGSWEIDIRTGRVRCSEDMCRITGIDGADTSSYGAFMANIIHPDDRQSVKKALQAALRENEYCRIEYRAILPGGSQHKLHVDGKVEHNDRLYRVTGVLRDVTIKWNLDVLQAPREGLGFNVLDMSPTPIAIVDNDGTVLYVNEAYQKMTGYDIADILGIKPPYPWWPAHLIEEYTGQMRRAVQSRTTAKKELLFKRKNGRSIWVEITAILPVKENDDIQYHFKYFIDVTEQRRLKENMQYYISEIIKTQEAERARIAHEIHDEIIQSLASIALEMDALRKGKNQIRDDIRARLQDLRGEIERLVNSLRHFSHDLHPSVIDQGLIPALEILTQEISKGTDTNITFTIYGKERELTVEKGICLFRIAQEAIRNVVKHSGATEATIKLRYTASTVKLTVADNGVGFELPDELGDLASAKKLGIIGMQERSRLLGGKLSLRSRSGKGTTVIVEAP